MSLAVGGLCGWFLEIFEWYLGTRPGLGRKTPDEEEGVSSAELRDENIGLSGQGYCDLVL